MPTHPDQKRLLERGIKGSKAKFEFSGKECYDLLVMSNVSSDRERSRVCKILATYFLKQYSNPLFVSEDISEDFGQLYSQISQ